MLLLQPEAFLRQSFFIKQFLMNYFQYKSWKNAGASTPKTGLVLVGWNKSGNRNKREKKLTAWILWASTFTSRLIPSVFLSLQMENLMGNSSSLCMLPVLFSAACLVFHTWLYRLLFILSLPAKGGIPRLCVLLPSSTPLSLRDHYCQAYDWSEHGDRCAVLGVVSEICVFHKHKRLMSVFQQLD